MGRGVDFWFLFSLMFYLFVSSDIWRSRVYQVPRSFNWAGFYVRKKKLPLPTLLWSSLVFCVNPNMECLLRSKQSAFLFCCFSVKSCSSTPSQHHQSAAKELTGTTEPTSPSSSSSSPTQTTYLTSAAQQRCKRPRHFLELKNFKDNYNTLDSTLWNNCRPAERKRSKTNATTCNPSASLTVTWTVSE